MKIGIDYDGVIADTLPIKLRCAKESFGVTILPERSKEWHVIADGLLTKAQYRELAHIVCAEKAGLSALPCDGSLEVIKSLLEAGHELSIITSREGAEIDIATEWNANHHLQLPLISTGYGKSKAEAAEGYDAYLDDDLPKLRDLIGVVPHLFLYNAPYNTADAGDDAIVRIGSWQEFHEHIRMLTH